MRMSAFPDVAYLSFSSALTMSSKISFGSKDTSHHVDGLGLLRLQELPDADGRRRSFADGRGELLRRSRAHVAGREDAGHVGHHPHPGQDQSAVVQIHHALDELRVRVEPDEHEARCGMELLDLARLPALQLD